MNDRIVTEPTREANLHNSVVTLLDSADDSGCDVDLIVVSKSALRLLAQQVLGELPAWLDQIAKEDL
jgi:hypothetical protein